MDTNPCSDIKPRQLVKATWIGGPNHKVVSLVDPNAREIRTLEFGPVDEIGSLTTKTRTCQIVVFWGRRYIVW